MVHVRLGSNRVGAIKNIHHHINATTTSLAFYSHEKCVYIFAEAAAVGDIARVRLLTYTGERMREIRIAHVLVYSVPPDVDK